MDLESECSVLESVEDNEENTNHFVSTKLENVGESKVQINGSCAVENDDDNSNVLFPEVKQKADEVLAHVNSPSLDFEPEKSLSPTTRRKGYGLKKWRRINRDSIKVGDIYVDTGTMATQDITNSGVNPSKRMQYAERKQKSEGSVSSTNAVVRTLDPFSPLDDSGFRAGPSFAAGTDSENSEDRSSRSSTAASAPRMKYEMPVIMRSLHGKNVGNLVQQGKGRIETSKKARGERVKIEKENSHSSVESDLRSSNFVFMQGPYSTNNEIRHERPKDYDGENGDEAQGSEQVSDGRRQGGYGRNGEAGYEDLSPEDVSSEIKEERCQNHGSSRDQDVLFKSVFELQSAKEALEKELLKIKEITKDISVDDSGSDLGPEYLEVEQKLQKTSSEQLPFGEGLQSFSRDAQSEVVEAENVFKQKIETEVACLVISRSVHNTRVSPVDQNTVLEETKALASEQTQILDKLGNAENKASELKKEAENLENFCQDIAIADETLKLQKKVCKYSSCFLVQLVFLLVILGVFMQLSPNYVEVVPT